MNRPSTAVTSPIMRNVPGSAVLRVRGRSLSRSTDVDSIRFRSFVDANGPVPKHRPALGNCWLWTSVRVPAGYGQFWTDGHYIPATHAALILDGRPLGPGQIACHHCDNPPCVRPSHLFRGSYSDNARDASAKGRHENCATKRPELLARGERHGMARLSATQVAEIRERKAEGGSTLALSREYGVSVTHIKRIAKGRCWRTAP